MQKIRCLPFLTQTNMASKNSDLCQKKRHGRDIQKILTMCLQT